MSKILAENPLVLIPLQHFLMFGGHQILTNAQNKTLAIQDSIKTNQMHYHRYNYREAEPVKILISYLVGRDQKSLRPIWFSGPVRALIGVLIFEYDARSALQIILKRLARHGRSGYAALGVIVRATFGDGMAFSA